jgi:hypothetical protein
MLKLEDFKKISDSEFFGTQFIYGGGQNTEIDSKRIDYAHTMNGGVDSVKITAYGPGQHTGSADNDPL